MRSDIAIEFDDVVAGYGEFMILNNLSLTARRGKITLLLGPNGAGKSTVLKTLFGLLKVRQGRIRLDGQDITGATAKDLLVQHGVAFVPQGRNLFGQLSVYENLELGGITLGMKTTHERIPEVLSLFPRVKERLHSAASSLPLHTTPPHRRSVPRCLPSSPMVAESTSKPTCAAKATPM